jgi:hypothetical protein
VVPHVGDALIVESHDIMDLCFLAEDLKELSDAQAAAVLAVLHAKGVMQSRALSFIAWLYGRKMKNPSKTAAYAYIFGNPRMLPSAQKMMDDVIRHMMTGRDKEDADSVGGFSTRELQFIANLAWAVKEGLSPAPSMAGAPAFATGDIVFIDRTDQFIERLGKVSYVDVDGGIWAFTYSDYPTGVKERFAPELVRPATHDEIASLAGFKDPQFPWEGYAKLDGEMSDAGKPSEITNKIAVTSPTGAVPTTVTERPSRFYGSEVTVDAPDEVYDLSPEERLDIANGAVAEHRRRKRLLRWERR